MELKVTFKHLKYFQTVPESPGSYADYAVFMRNVVYASKSQIEELEPKKNRNQPTYLHFLNVWQ